MLMVHIDAADIAAVPAADPGSVVPGRVPRELDGIGPVTRALVRRLGCDASTVGVVEDAEGTVISVGKRTRTVPSSVRRALRLRDGGCRFPGCHARRFVDAHHVRHWIEGGESSLGNLIELCRVHHRLVHEGGFRVEQVGDGRWLFRAPSGEPIPDVPARPYLGRAEQRLRESNRRKGVAMGPATIVPRWAGEDVSVFCYQVVGDLFRARRRRLYEMGGPTDHRFAGNRQPDSA
jgi:hypothetical protein